MKLEQQVISLELSQRLEKLDVKQESAFYWAPAPTGWKIQIGKGSYLSKVYSAFTVAELGEMLPPLYESYLCAGIHEWRVNLNMGARDKHTQYPTMRADTEAEARGLMLEYLIKSNLMSV